MLCLKDGSEKKTCCDMLKCTKPFVSFSKGGRYRKCEGYVVVRVRYTNSVLNRKKPSDWLERFRRGFGNIEYCKFPCSILGTRNYEYCRCHCHDVTVLRCKHNKSGDLDHRTIHHAGVASLYAVTSRVDAFSCRPDFIIQLRVFAHRRNFTAKQP